MYPRGVTTLELVIAMGVLALIFGISATGLSRLQRSTANLSTEHDMVSALVLAARRARSGRDNTAWGVYIPYNETTRLTTSVTVFAGNSYAARDASKDLTLTVNDDVAFTSVDFSGSAPDAVNSHEIVFQTFSGATTQYGSLTLTWFGAERVISIGANGIPAIQ